MQPKNYLFAFTHPYHFAFDEADPAGGGAGDPPAKETFTKDELNQLVAAEREKLTKANDGIIKELTALKQRSNLTDTERKDLEKRVEELSGQLLTKDQLSKKEIERREKDAKAALDNLTSDRDTWKNRFVDRSIESELSQAATEHKAYNPKQVVQLLRGNTQVVEDKDDAGNVTGLSVKVTLDDVDDKGQPVKLTMTPNEAVKHLTDKEDFLNLFIQNGAPGLNRSTQKGGTLDARKIAAENPKLFRELRAQGKI